MLCSDSLWRTANASALHRRGNANGQSSRDRRQARRGRLGISSLRAPLGGTGHFIKISKFEIKSNFNFLLKISNLIIKYSYNERNDKNFKIHCTMKEVKSCTTGKRVSLAFVVINIYTLYNTVHVHEE